ncbi:MAG: phosphoribosylamine--glycine ligase [Ignavibacteriales bacterium]|nr:phosphoribosylamine--glycine ligase [Ignavibacteriales bacterium]
MNVALIGSGGREHALAYQISKSSSLDKLYNIPGNTGTESLGENISIKGNPEIINFCKSKEIDLVVIGPELPLVDGLANELRKNNIIVFGPNSEAAMIEGDKSFSKWLMKKYGIPTAGFKTFHKSQYDEVFNYLRKSPFPVVIKASGLAAGKGVLICNNKEEAEFAIKDIFLNEVFGSAGDSIVVEEFMFGEEASIFAITDGENFVCLPAAQDHKRIGYNDTGKNTGGMGAYAPAPIITQALLKEIEENIIFPTLSAMKKEDKTFSGCLYCGLMITSEGPKVVEFNCRFGDPETQVVLPLLEGDLLKLLYSAAVGKLEKEAVKYNGGSAVCVVAASKGYPDKFEKGFEIKGLEQFKSDNTIVFHAGTKRESDKIITNGGRVLGVTALTVENNLKFCKDKVYEAIKKIEFENIYYRTDIADKGIKRLRIDECGIKFCNPKSAI